MNIVYSDEIPSGEAIYDLYEQFGWNEFLKLSARQLHDTMRGSWYVASAYDGGRLIGTGRVVSDGVMTAFLCGLAVHPDYQKKGIGSELMKRLMQRCITRQLHMELFCSDPTIGYYERFGFEVFASGMKYRKEGRKSPW
ncbi:GNAT family N-acetyltransferase [Paenibacillus chitinolyticus]|uniref:GNAT family N-acetyltransferase n=1 Tax=Paenibacillus chitinolyticus TaxID=79263 RepID=UPI00366B62C8